MAYTECYLEKKGDKIRFYYHHLGIDKDDDSHFQRSFKFEDYKKAMQKLKETGKCTIQGDYSTLKLITREEKVRFKLKGFDNNLITNYPLSVFESIITNKVNKRENLLYRN